MSLGILTHQELYNVNGGALGAALNTWYPIKLTSNPVNEDSVIQSLDVSAGVYSFTLAPGTYRIEAKAVFGPSYTFSASARNATAAAVLYNETDALVAAIFSPGHIADSASSLAGSGAAGATIPTAQQIILFCYDIFTVAGATKTFSFRGAVNGTENWAALSNCRGYSHNQGQDLGAIRVPNIYLVAKITLKT